MEHAPPPDAVPLVAAASDGPDGMGKEIAQGPSAVAATLGAVASVTDQVQPMIDEAERIVIVATGASLAVSHAAAPLWHQRVRGLRSVLVRHSTEAVLGLDGETVRPDDLVVAVSQSGTSPETVAAARQASGSGARVIAITAHPASTLAQDADVVVQLGSGDEQGAATKSALASLAALLALAGALSTDGPAIGRLVDRLTNTLDQWGDAVTDGRYLADADRIWFLGFGAAAGLAEAAALLWHEKVRRPSVAATPSEFRHGQIEAANERAAVVLMDVDQAEARRTSYLDRLRAELAALRVPILEVPNDSRGVTQGSPAETAMVALLRLQQLARASALAAGTYREEFAVLRRVVTPADDLLT